MSMNKNTYAGKSNIPVQSDVFGTATEHLNTESDAESDPTEPHIEDEQMTEKSDHAKPIIEPTQVKMTAGNESEGRDDSEKTES
ncbi:hypothetical protein DY000_02026328 [Brassica cretica]|uniref:Uncharacterized protein n=1 Tax=Brassica cretica TaxID=69181 RepID=A0ABQ7EE56_BRACR|nr:hypothetical protein DY000_02026328 [Brassica cretica]